MSINHVAISGNLGRDAELRSTRSGMAILNFGVAVNERKKNNQTGDWDDYTNWIDCVLFGTRAEKIANYLTKGTKVAVEGKLRWSQWEKNGEKRSKIEVVVDEIEFMTNRGNNSASYEASTSSSGPAIAVEATVYDDNIPF